MAPSKQERVAASFVSRYFELLMTDAKQLSSLYIPKAQFNHEGKTTPILGSENISRALLRLYPAPNHGRVVIKDMKVQPTEASAGRFAVSVGGTYFRRGAAEGEDFRHIIELQEHPESNGAFGIYADTRQDLSKPGPTAWAMETPPMFAKAGNEAAIPDLVQPPASAPVTASAPAKEAKTPTPKASPKVQHAAAPEPEAVLQEAPAAAEAATTVVDAPAPTVVETTPAAKPSFLELVRAAAPKTSVTAAPARIEAKTEAAKAKEEAERLAKEKEEKEKEGKKPQKNDSGSTSKKTDRKPSSKKSDASAPAAEKGADNKKPDDAAERKPRKEGGKTMSQSVVFYDVIVKGLPADATDKTVSSMLSPMAPVKKVSVKSQPDKKDANITRTFAFVLFDHDAIASTGTSLKDTIARVQKESRAKYGAQRIQVDEVREKFTQEEPREKKTVEADA